MNKEDITIKNIKSFILGNLTYYAAKVIKLPEHLKEQYYYRLYVCRNTCLLTGVCKNCNCPVLKKAYAPDSCNKEAFPNFLSGSEWNKYKEENNITNIKEIIKEVENELK